MPCLFYRSFCLFHPLSNSLFLHFFSFSSENEVYKVKARNAQANKLLEYSLGVSCYVNLCCSLLLLHLNTSLSGVALFCLLINLGKLLFSILTYMWHREDGYFVICFVLCRYS